MKKLKAFTKNHYEKNSEEAATYWKGLFLEYGELELHSISKDYSNQNNLGVFLRGKQTKGWGIIMLRMNEDNTKVIGKSVGKGMLPSEGVSSDHHSLSSKELVPTRENYLEDLKKTDYFSGSVLVAKGDSILFEKTYGLRDK